MLRNMGIVTAVALSAANLWCTGQDGAQDRTADQTAIEGLWMGSWGGGDGGDGVVFQPAIAELMIQGDHVELSGFGPGARLAGTWRLDESARRMHITGTAQSGETTTQITIDFAYQYKNDRLTLTDKDELSVTFERFGSRKGDPLANSQVELVRATGINESGELLVTDYTVLRAGRTGSPFFRALPRALSTRDAIVLLVEETDCRKIAIDEARRLTRPSAPVVVTYRHRERSSRNQPHQLWRDLGRFQPDSDEVCHTFARILRPGTLVFVLSGPPLP